MNYKAIIVGGSFAGLSTAHHIRRDGVVLLEKERELGLKQRSTCGTFVDVLTKSKCEKSILKTFDTITFHSSLGSKAVVEMPRPICTFDYKVYCDSMADRLGNVEIVTDSEVLKVDGRQQKKEIHCRGKDYRSEIVVDCSGWRAVTTKNSTKRVDTSEMAYGIESEVEYEGDTDSVQIYFGSKFAEAGYGWVFPVGETRARVGIGSYLKSDISKQLHKFMKFLDVNVEGIETHGGLLPCFGLKEPISEGIFRVGDSCGQVLPFSGEGIRKSICYGEICGSLVSRVLNGELRLSEARDIYKREVYESNRLYDSLYLIQKVAIQAPDKALDHVIRKWKDKRSAKKFLEIYLESRNYKLLNWRKFFYLPVSALFKFNTLQKSVGSGIKKHK